MFQFDPDDYGSACCELLSDDRVCALDAGQSDSMVHSRLKQLTDEAVASGRAIKDRAMVACCRSALWLKHDFLDESHRISQDIDTPSGSYWHGIMHRREGDFSNAKYWFRQVGAHPVFAKLASEANVRWTGKALKELTAGSDWDSLRFVDLCASADNNRDLLCNIAHLEWQLLFDHCYRQGILVG